MSNITELKNQLGIDAMQESISQLVELYSNSRKENAKSKCSTPQQTVSRPKPTETESVGMSDSINEFLPPRSQLISWGDHDIESNTNYDFNDFDLDYFSENSYNPGIQHEEPSTLSAGTNASSANNVFKPNLASQKAFDEPSSEHRGDDENNNQVDINWDIPQLNTEEKNKRKNWFRISQGGECCC